MNRRDFFRGVGAAAATLALDPVPAALVPFPPETAWYLVDDAAPPLMWLCRKMTVIRDDVALAKGILRMRVTMVPMPIPDFVIHAEVKA